MIIYLMYSSFFSNFIVPKKLKRKVHKAEVVVVVLVVVVVAW